jgi:excisionase family DNA binding protein
VLTVAEAAERMGVSDSLVYELCKAGLIRHTRHGRPGKRGCIRIEENDLQAYLAASIHEIRPPAPPLKHIKIHG